MRGTRMKLALAALALLAGCAAQPAAPAQTAESAAPAAAAAAAADLPPLHRLQRADEDEFVQLEMITDPNGEYRARLWVTDLDTGRCAVPCTVQGCTHDSSACPGVLPWLYSGMAYILNEETLLYPGSGQFCVSGRRGEDFRTLLNIPYLLYEQYTDGQYLYLAQQLPYPETPACCQLLRIDPHSGSYTVLATFEGEADQLQAAGRELLLNLFAYDPNAAATSSATTRRWCMAVNADTGESRLLYDYDPRSEECPLGTPVEGTAYLFDETARVLTGRDIAGGETVWQSDAFPAPALAGEVAESFQPVRVLDGWLEVNYGCYPAQGGEGVSFSYLVNLESGEVRRKPDLPELVWNGYGHQPTVYAQLKDQLLVACRAEPYTYTAYGQDGSPYTVHSERLRLGLITYRDYLNGTPNYRELEAYA